MTTKLVTVLSVLALVAIGVRYWTAKQIYPRCEWPPPSNTVTPYPEPKSYPPFSYDENGAVIITKEVIVAGIDFNVIHGVVRKVTNQCELIVESVVDDPNDIDVKTARKGQKRVVFRIQANPETVIDNVQKYKEDIDPGDPPAPKSFRDIKIGDIVIAFGKSDEKVILKDSFVATRIDIQTPKYWDVILVHFAKYGIHPKRTLQPEE